MEFIILALIGIVILMLCFVIFALGIIYENAIMIREIDDKIEELNAEVNVLLNARVGEDNA